ncbi:MAG: hypothetical protein V1922_04370 [bacterium]
MFEQEPINQRKLRATKRVYLRDPQPILPLIAKWKRDFDDGSLLTFGQKNKSLGSFHFTEQVKDIHLSGQHVDGALSLESMPKALVDTLLDRPQIVMVHCANSSSLHGEVEIHLFREQDVNNPVLQALLTKMDMSISGQLDTTSNVIIRIADAPRNVKVDPPLQTITTASMYDAIVGVLGIKNPLLEELTNPEIKQQLWGLLYTCFKHNIVSGRYKSEFTWDAAANRAIETVDPDVFIPEYVRSIAPYGDKLHKFSLGLLGLDMKQGEFEESLREALGINTPLDTVNWNSIFSGEKDEIKQFMDRYPYFKLGCTFDVHPYVFKTDTICTFQEFSRRLNDALALSYGKKTAILRVPTTAIKLQDIEGVPNYDISDGQNTVGINLSRSSGLCAIHSANKYAVSNP